MEVVMKLLIQLCPGWPGRDGNVGHSDTVLIATGPRLDLKVDTLSHGTCQDCQTAMLEMAARGQDRFFCTHIERRMMAMEEVQVNTLIRDAISNLDLDNRLSNMAQVINANADQLGAEQTRIDEKVTAEETKNDLFATETERRIAAIDDQLFLSDPDHPNIPERIDALDRRCQDQRDSIVDNFNRIGTLGNEVTGHVETITGMINKLVDRVAIMAVDDRASLNEIADRVRALGELVDNGEYININKAESDRHRTNIHELAPNKEGVKVEQFDVTIETRGRTLAEHLAMRDALVWAARMGVPDATVVVDQVTDFKAAFERAQAAGFTGTMEAFADARDGTGDYSPDVAAQAAIANRLRRVEERARGDQPDPVQAAYDIATANGYTGTLGEYVSRIAREYSIIPVVGMTDEEFQASYTLAQWTGFTGTAQQFADTRHAAQAAADPVQAALDGTLPEHLVDDTGKCVCGQDCGAVAEWKRHVAALAEATRMSARDPHTDEAEF